MEEVLCVLNTKFRSKLPKISLFLVLFWLIIGMSIPSSATNGTYQVWGRSIDVNLNNYDRLVMGHSFDDPGLIYKKQGSQGGIPCRAYYMGDNWDRSGFQLVTSGMAMIVDERGSSYSTQHKIEGVQLDMYFSWASDSYDREMDLTDNNHDNIGRGKYLAQPVPESNGWLSAAEEFIAEKLFTMLLDYYGIGFAAGLLMGDEDAGNGVILGNGWETYYRGGSWDYQKLKTTLDLNLFPGLNQFDNFVIEFTWTVVLNDDRYNWEAYSLNYLIYFLKQGSALGDGAKCYGGHNDGSTHGGYM